MDRFFLFRYGAKLFVRSTEVLLLIAAMVPAQQAAAQQVLLSSTTDGISGGGESTAVSLSADGQVAAFQSTASDLHPGDRDTIPDIYLTSTSSPRPFVASVSSGANPLKGDGPSRFPSLSGDGVRVLFTSEAKSLAADDRNGFADIFLRDVAVGTTERVSISTAGTEGDDGSDRGVLSRNGRFVAFSSRAGNLAAPQAPRGTSRIHVRDLDKRTTLRIDLPGGLPADADCLLPDISADGRWVVFQTASTGFGEDGNDFQDVYLHDVLGRRTKRVSVAPLGAEPDGPSFAPRISADGRFVAFESLAKNLVGKDPNRSQDVFVRDMHTGSIERVSPGPAAAAARMGLADLSDDGRVVLLSTESALLPIDGNGLFDLYAFDRIRSSLRLVSSTFLFGPPRAGDGASPAGAVSADGSLLAFESTSTDLAPGDRDQGSDIFFLGVGGPRPGPFPASNHVLVNAGGAVRQVDLAGAPTGRTLRAGGLPTAALCVDEFNTLWVAASNLIGRLEALSLEPPPGEPPFFTDVPGNSVRALVAARGFAFAAVDQSIFRLAPDAEPLRFDLSEPAESLFLALDPEKRLWASVGRPGRHDLIRLGLDLRVLGSSRRPMADPFGEIAFDARGAVLLRSRGEVAKLSPAGAALWTQPVPQGRGLAVDGGGNVYTLAGREVLGFRPDGRIFLRVPHGLAQVPAGSSLFLDGAGNLWCLLEGAPGITIVDPRVKPARVIAVPVGAVGPVGAQPAGDPAGYLAANISAQTGDMDADGFLNRGETDSSFNPLDPKDPPATRRVAAVQDITAKLDVNRSVRLSWSSPVQYAQVFVFRDGRPIRGSPFPFSTAAAGIVDTNVPGGPHRYEVIGQGFAGGGGGAGLGGSEIEEPFSLSTLASVSLGEGELRAYITVDPAPDAVIHDAAAASVIAILQGGLLVTLDEDLLFQSEVELPADPFATAEVRGLAIDAAAPGRPLFLLLGDGRVFRRVGNAAPTADVTFSGMAPSPAGFTGLAIVGDLFGTMAGPDVDCLIGFLRSNGSFDPDAEESISSTLGLDVATSLGLSRLGGSLLAGTGYGMSGASTITRVEKLDLGPGPGFGLANGNANVNLGALGSTDIAGFDLAPGVGLIIADRANSRIAILEATFPGSPQVLSITPGSGHFERTTTGVAIEGIGFGSNLDDLWVGFENVSMPITAFQPAVGRITIDADAPGHPLPAVVEVFNSTGSDVLVPGFIYGFQRGDANDDGSMDISDAMRILMFLFAGVQAPPCMDAADSTDSELIDLSDAIRILDYLFRGDPPPPTPFPQHGLDTGDPTLGCGDE